MLVTTVFHDFWSGSWVRFAAVTILLSVHVSALDGALDERTTSSGIGELVRRTTVNESDLATETQLRGHVCRLWQHESLLIDGYIYVDQNLLTMENSYKDGFMQVGYPFIVDTTQEFLLGDLQFDSSFVATPNRTTSSGKTLPMAYGSAAWYDNDERIYKYGGIWPDNATWLAPGDTLKVRPTELWYLDFSIPGWEQDTTWTSDKYNPLVSASSGASVSVPDQGLGFYMGGIINNMTDAEFSSWNQSTDLMQLGSMIMFDTKTNAFTNATVFPDLGPNSLAKLTSLPLSEKGVLIAMGGWTSPKQDIGFTDSEDATGTPFNRTYIYDIATTRWYSQTTTGTAPDERIGFCIATAISPDNSSYNIFLHGGMKLDRSSAFDDVWVLSIPSFEWIKIGNYGDDHARGWHTCHVMNDKLLVVGGKGADQPQPGMNSTVTGTHDNGKCDKNGMLNILDVTTFEWETHFSPTKQKNYTVNAKISAVIGGSTDGGAKKIEPEDGWEYDSLADIFKLSIAPSSTNNTSTPSSKQSKKSHLGAIIGGAVGGFFGLAIIAGLIALFLIHRRKRSSSSPDGPNANTAYAPAPTHPPHQTGPAEAVGDATYYSDDQKASWNGQHPDQQHPQNYNQNYTPQSPPMQQQGGGGIWQSPEGVSPPHEFPLNEQQRRPVSELGGGGGGAQRPLSELPAYVR